MIDTGGVTPFRRTRGTTHWIPDPLHTRKRKCAIGNGINFKRPNMPWAETNSVVADSAGVPPDFDGNYDFADNALDAPMQVFFGDTTDSSARVMWGFRRADKPHHWANIRPLQPNANVAAHQRSANRALWTNVWQATNLRVIANDNGVVKELVLRNSNAPTKFRLSVLSSPALTFAVVNERLVWRDSNGDVSMRSKPAWGADSATLANTPDGKNHIRVAVEHIETRVVNGKTFEVIEITPNAADMAGAIYPVTIDPSVDLTGATDIEDAKTHSAFGDINFGGLDSISMTSDASVVHIQTTLIRPTASSIPDGAIDAATLKLVTAAARTATINAYKVVAANLWVGGSQTFATETGACDRNHAKHATLNWAGGSTGCSSSSDFVADGSPPSASVTGAGNPNDSVIEWSLVTQWFEDWRDGVGTNNGFVMLEETSSADTTKYWSTEYTTASKRPIITVDYTALAAGGYYYQMINGRRRR